MKNELLKGLTDEQIAQVKACKNIDEIITLADKEGIELTEEQLKTISGGACTSTGLQCPKCSSTDLKNIFTKKIEGIVSYTYKCKKCGHTWTVL